MEMLHNIILLNGRAIMDPYLCHNAQTTNYYIWNEKNIEYKNETRPRSQFKCAQFSTNPYFVLLIIDRLDCKEPFF